MLAADLILGASREHREQIGLMDPWAGGRTFSIREFARFAGRVDAAALPVAGPAFLDDACPDDDIPDPFGAPLHVFRLCASSIAEGLSRLVGPLAAVASHRRTGDAAR